MKLWLITYVDMGIQTSIVEAFDVLNALQICCIPPQLIVSIQSVNTDAPVSSNLPTILLKK